MLHPRVVVEVGEGGGVDLVPGGEEVAVGEVIITTLARGMGTEAVGEEEQVATPTLALVVGGVATAEVVGVVGEEGAMEDLNRAMGKWPAMQARQKGGVL